MAEWFGDHRGIFVLLVLLGFAVMWRNTGLDPVLRLITAWRFRQPASDRLVKRAATAVAFGIYGVFLGTQFAMAAGHVWLSAPSEYSIWFFGSLVIPFIAQWGIGRIARRRLATATRFENQLAIPAQLPWRAIAIVAAVLLSLPVIELTIETPWGWLLPAMLIAVGTVWRWLHSLTLRHS